jgi:curved DNA-binding protein CbpA
MIDYFALLGEPRSPWLDPEALKRKFLALSAQFHPDRVHGEAAAEQAAAQAHYTDLNAAYQCLREPKLRLKHWLLLERGAAPQDFQGVDPDLMELFGPLSDACREADALVRQKADLASALLEAQWFGRAQECGQKLREVQRRVKARTGRLEQALRELGSRWCDATPTSQARGILLEQGEELYRLFGFLTRWNQQIEERLAQLYA